MAPITIRPSIVSSWAADPAIGLSGSQKKRPPEGVAAWLENGRRKRKEEGTLSLLSLGLHLLALQIALPTTLLFNLIALFAHKNLYFANPVRLVYRRNMKRQRRAFNTYFLGLCICCFLPLWVEAANSTNEVKKTEEVKKKKSKKKEISTVRVHLEVPRDTSGRSAEVPILRENSMLVNVEKVPFLTEGFLAEAKVIDTPGGKEIELYFNTMGQTALGNYTAANRGRRLAIYCEFDKERRWVAAPKITKLLPDGILRFTPDASPEEVERIVRGLNTIAEIKKKKDKF